MTSRFREILGTPESCPYLPGLQATTRYRVFETCTPVVYEALLARGWRRFGRVFFRPECPSCTQCVSLRVDVAEFEPSRSMRRTARANRDLRVDVGPPRLDRDRLDLYRRYHADMSARRGWRAKEAVEPEEYAGTFLVGGGEYAFELAVHAPDGRLLAVGLHDVLPNAISAVYTYYEPLERRRGLGVFTVLELVRRAAETDRSRVYLGYRVLGNPSMRYKARYRPHELLDGRPDDARPPVWNRPVPAPSDGAASARPASAPQRPRSE